MTRLLALLGILLHNWAAGLLVGAVCGACWGAIVFFISGGSADSLLDPSRYLSCLLFSPIPGTIGLMFGVILAGIWSTANGIVGGVLTLLYFFPLDPSRTRTYRKVIALASVATSVILVLLVTWPLLGWFLGSMFPTGPAEEPDSSPSFSLASLAWDAALMITAALAAWFSSAFAARWYVDEAAVRSEASAPNQAGPA